MSFNQTVPVNRDADFVHVINNVYVKRSGKIKFDLNNRIIIHLGNILRINVIYVINLESEDYKASKREMTSNRVSAF